MNGIEDNEFSQRWKSMAKEIPLPKAVIVVSAHWLTKGTLITAMDFPKTIHDFGGFPEKLFQVKYPAPGSPSIAKETASTTVKTPAIIMILPDSLHSCAKKVFSSSAAATWCIT